MIRPSRQSIRTQHLPAPLGGLNTVAPASAMPATDCAWVYNLIPGNRGLDSRPGYAEWRTGLVGGLTGEVRSVLPFAGSGASKNRLFAVTCAGIYDVTASGAAPTLEIAFDSEAGQAGFGASKVVVTAAGHFLLYADEVNGLHVYTESTDTWAAVGFGAGAGEISGVDPATFVNVGTFKGRVWFTARDSSKVWYLDAGAVFGAATSFELGGQLPHGGTIVGLYNWTYDGGGGLDDSAVFLGSGGDLAIYQGTDPASADTFGLKGVWYVGDTLRGRRVATDSGGDVLILSRLGLVPLSRLVTGASTRDASLYATEKINNLFVALAARFGGDDGWGVQVHPTVNALLVTLPDNGLEIEQLAMSLTTKSWWPWRGLPILSACAWNGELYFGTRDGRVCRNTGSVDDVLRTDATSWDAVEWSVLPAFRNLGRPTQKKVEQVRPTILASNASASIKATARYGYDLTEPTAPSSNGGGGADAWDSAVWDGATWQPEVSASQPILGTFGMGREVSVALQGRAISPTTLVGVDVYFTEGGSM